MKKDSSTKPTLPLALQRREAEVARLLAQADPATLEAFRLAQRLIANCQSYARKVLP